MAAGASGTFAATATEAACLWGTPSCRTQNSVSRDLHGRGSGATPSRCTTSGSKNGGFLRLTRMLLARLMLLRLGTEACAWQRRQHGAKRGGRRVQRSGHRSVCWCWETSTGQRGPVWWCGRARAGPSESPRRSTAAMFNAAQAPHGHEAAEAGRLWPGAFSGFTCPFVVCGFTLSSARIAPGMM